MWLTSGSHRLKANLSRSFGARKTKKAAAGKKDVGYKVYLKSTRLRIIRKDITRSEQSVHDSEICHESNFADTAYARERHKSRNRAPLMERRKEESTRLSHTHDVTRSQFRDDLFSADSIEQILALQELHRQREFEQPQENRICCQDIQLADGIVHSNKMPSAHYQSRREHQKRRIRDSFTPITKNSHYQSQPQQQTLKFFNKGFEVDVNGIPLSACLS